MPGGRLVVGLAATTAVAAVILLGQSAKEPATRASTKDLPTAHADHAFSRAPRSDHRIGIQVTGWPRQMPVTEKQGGSTRAGRHPPDILLAEPLSAQSVGAGPLIAIGSPLDANDPLADAAEKGAAERIYIGPPLDANDTLAAVSAQDGADSMKIGPLLDATDPLAGASEHTVGDPIMIGPPIDAGYIGHPLGR